MAALLGSFRAAAPEFAATLLGSFRTAAPVLAATLLGIAAFAAPISAAATYDRAARLAPASFAALFGIALGFATTALLLGIAFAAPTALGAILLLGIAARRELRSGATLLNFAVDGPMPTAGLAFDAGLGVSAAKLWMPRQPTAARMAS